MCIILVIYFHCKKFIMGSTFYIVFLFLTLSSIISAEIGQNVKQLTDSTIEAAIQDNELILIKFYAPWCGHCRKLAPQYSKAADILTEIDPTIVMAELDATTEKKSAKEWKITGFPTMILFQKGEKVDIYEGERTSEAMSRYMLDHSI